MLNSGKKIRASRYKKINILTLVLSEKKFLNETKNHDFFLGAKQEGLTIVHFLNKLTVSCKEAVRFPF